MKVTVEKRKLDGMVVTRYEGKLISHHDMQTIIECRFTFDAVKPYVSFCCGDRSVETFYHDRWYHIVELHSVIDDQLKGWYCNITFPPTIRENSNEMRIVYTDLEIDVFVDPKGNFLILDEDELGLLNLDPKTERQVWSSVESLRKQVLRKELPFHKLTFPNKE